MQLITIALSEDRKIETAFNRPINFDDYLVAVFTSLLATARHVVSSEADPRDQDATLNGVYDLINNAASNTLTLLAPHFDLRPTLTELAIRNEEDRIMQKVIDMTGTLVQ